MRYTYKPFEVEGREFAPTGQDPAVIEVWSDWRGRAVLICTLAHLDTIAQITWEPGWADNPPEWKTAIENAAVKARTDLSRTCEG